MNEKYQILKDVFGHEKFRSFQEEVVDTVLNKQDVLTILPTGGGKSLCYQLPTLLMQGVTIVISPLIALMQDQVKALNGLNIKSAMINSLNDEMQNTQIMQEMLEGNYKFIYVAPERFTSNDFVSVLQRVNINYFVIDEAHCVSAWGHEFRAEYRNLDRLKQFFPNTPIAAFTATATKKVQEDISTSLNLENPKHFRAKTVRDNLDIKVEPRISNGKNQILNFLKAPLKKLTKTYLETFELIENGKDIEEISQIRDLGITSVLSHISLLFEHKKISKEKKQELLKPLQIPDEIKNWIESGLNLDSLKQLKQYLYLYEYLNKENN